MKNICLTIFISLTIISCNKTESKTDTDSLVGKSCDSWHDCNNRCCGCEIGLECIKGKCVETDIIECADAYCCSKLYGCNDECLDASPHGFDETCGNESCDYYLSERGIGCCTSKPDTDLWVDENACGLDGGAISDDLLGLCLQNNQPGIVSENCSDIELEYKGEMTNFTGCCTTKNVCSYQLPPLGCARWEFMKEELELSSQPTDCIYIEP